jgi:two-component system, NarL family, response regulator LiaR
MLLFGGVGGVLIVVLRVIEYRWLVLHRSLELYGGLVALLFAGVGLWLGQRLRPVADASAVTANVRTEAAPAAAPIEPFSPDPVAVARSGLTPRELNILALIAAGLSTREIAARVGVSENTVKTHSSRIYAKLDVNRRTQAVQVARERRLIG